MESKKINQLATELAPELSDLTIIGDPTTGISKKITLSQMASLFTGTVEEYANLASFPLVGAADTIYIALDTNIIYRWNTSTSAYVELSPNIVTSLVFNDANGFDGTISLVGSTATLTITTALTTGSVGFIGASGALTQDNSNFFWDNSNKRLGINTSTPTTALDVFGSGIIGRVNGTSTNNAFLGFASAGTNKWSIGNVQSDHRFRIYSEANTSELVSVLQTGEFGIGIANPLTKLHIFGGASALIANLDANTSVAKSISYRSGNSSRINLEVSGTESGSNAGMDFFLRTYTDAGALLATPLTITRSTSAATFASTIAATQLTLNTFSSGRNLRLSSNPTGIEFYNTVGTVRNWQISAQSINDQSLDFTPSTANGGTTYSTPILSLHGVNNRATILGDLLVKKSGAPQAIFSVDGTTGLFFRDGTNAAWKSWQIATSYNDGSDLSFIPSTNTSGTPTWGSTAMVIQGNGRVGIGIVSPNYLLDVYTNTGATTARFVGGNESIRLDTSSASYDSSLRFYNNNSATYWAIIQSGPAALSGGGLSMYTVGSYAMTLGTNSIERLRITNSGDIGINSSNTYGWKTRIVSSSTTSSAYGLQILAGTNSSDIAFSVRPYVDSGNYFIIRGDGYMSSVPTYNNTYSNAANLYIGSDGFMGRSTASSLRFKENINDWNESGLNAILALKPKTFKYKKDYYNKADIEFLGLIAEEVAKVNPYFADYEFEDRTGNVENVRYAYLTVPLIKAIQELKAELDELKSK